MKYLIDLRRLIGFTFIILITGVMFIGFSAGYVKAKTFNPMFDPDNFTTPRDINNPFLTLIPKSAFCYEAETEDGTELDEVIVTDCDTITIDDGLHTILVRDSVWLDDGEETVLTEDTFDIYAQDDNGNVWYLGEASKECDSGSTEGSWITGADAEPGIVMINENDLVPGISYMQEFKEGEAEDMAKVQRLNANVSDYCDKDCLETKEWTKLERGAIGFKFYAQDITDSIGGMVLDEDLKGGKTVMSELVDVVPPADALSGTCPSSYNDALNNIICNSAPPDNCDFVE